MATSTRGSRAESDTRESGAAESLASQLGLNRLGEQLQGLLSAMAERGVSAVTDRLDGTAGKAAKNMAGGDSAPKAALKAGVQSVKDTGASAVSSAMDKVGDVFSGDSDEKGKKDKQFKFINIVEELDLPVPRAVAYRAWTQFEEFPSFMKKVENVEQQEDDTVEWKAQIFWSHRSWTAEIIDQVPNERVVWRSKGEKGHVDGAITFHELTPDLTRMLVNLEYYPQGLFERTGNLWRAQGRRVRLELKFFRRYVTSHVLLHQDEVEGWSGEIHDGDVTEPSSDSSEQESEQKPPPSSAPDGESEAGSKPSSRTASKGAAKQPASATSSSRPRPAAKKSTRSESSSSRSRTTAKKSSSGSAAPSRGGSARKTTSSSSRSRS
ncbi:MAG TPA: SRPBCC family protein [Propionibacteriaceae bacterium]|nr:SRPBCC family protein [Propionibacteriaceae bacterium]